MAAECGGPLRKQCGDTQTNTAKWGRDREGSYGVVITRGAFNIALIYCF